MQCSARTKSGNRCKNKARPNSQFCGRHASLAHEQFDYDVFLSYGSNDKQTVHALAERLRGDGVRVWLDDWVIQPGSRDRDGERLAHLEKSRTLVMCMSPDYFESEWGKLEHHSMLFRDPTNAKRRFLPLLIKQCNTPDIIAQFAHIDWRTSGEEEYEELLRACRQEKQESGAPLAPQTPTDQARIVLEGHDSEIQCVAVTPDGKTIISGSNDNYVKVWDLETGHCRATLEGHTGNVVGVGVTSDGKTILSTSWDHTLRFWSLESGDCVESLDGGPGGSYTDLAISPGIVVSRNVADNLGVWDLDGKRFRCDLKSRGNVRGVSISRDGEIAASGSTENVVNVWDLNAGRLVYSLEGHTGRTEGVAITSDRSTVVSTSQDRTLKVWDIKTGQCRATFEGHAGTVWRVKLTGDDKTVVSASDDKTVKVWELSTGRCIATFEGHTGRVTGLAITPDGTTVISGSSDKTLRVWDLPTPHTTVEDANAARYTNAKVVLVGESGAGKTGLALRLAEDRWQETESTHGMNVWPLRLPGLDAGGMEREVWLWDFAGQPDYRLIHQLYMDETALALLVIDPQRDNPLEPLEHWEKALLAAVRHDPARMLIAARCDRGGFTISRKKIDKHCTAQGYLTHLNTSAKTAEGCDDLKTLIADNIPWDRLSWTATSRLFKTLKDAILAVKEEGMALVRISELRQRLQLELQDESIEMTALRTVVGLLESQGIVKKLDFGDFVLLQPQQINNYASAVVRCARENKDEIGAVPERDVLEALIDFKDMKRPSEVEEQGEQNEPSELTNDSESESARFTGSTRLEEADEKLLLRATVQTFLDRSLCTRVDTEKGTQLVFPSYFKIDRPAAPDVPPVVVTYGFSGSLDEIYSTLVVRLHYTEIFESPDLWRYAADFKTKTGDKLGLQLKKKDQGTAELEVYFNADVDINSKVTFITYIHEHLKKYADDVTRVRSYVCPQCSEPMENKRAIAIRVSKGLSDAICSVCGELVPLNDLIETKFASDEFLRTVQDMDAQAQINLDNESLELILVGHAFSITGEAGHIFRPTANSDWGIDGEIEYKNEEGCATGQRVYLQLKSGDSYLYKRKRDGAEVFTIKKQRQAEYWVNQAYPVMLVIRTSDGEIRWMNITEYLRQYGAGTKQVAFEGEAFTAGNVALMRNSSLGDRKE